MNILPKKTWHVRRKENIAKVKADEAQAAEEEKEVNRRLQLAEQESRTQFLRDRARSRAVAGSSSDAGTVAISDPKTLGLFNDVDEGRNVKVFNVDHEKEKLEEQEKKEKDIGLLTYLGQSVRDAKGAKTWWQESRKKPAAEDEAPKKAGEEWDVKKKRCHDPLMMMKKVEQRISIIHVERSIADVKPTEPRTAMLTPGAPKDAKDLPKDIVVPKDSSRKRHFDEVSPEPVQPKKRSKTDSNKKASKKKHKKHSKKKNKSKRKHKKRHHSSSSDDSSSSSCDLPRSIKVTNGAQSNSVAQSTTSLDALRMERLKRERAERSREVEIMFGTVKTAETKDAPVDDRSRAYNSVFNRDFVPVRKRPRRSNLEIVRDIIDHK